MSGLQVAHFMILALERASPSLRQLCCIRLTMSGALKFWRDSSSKTSFGGCTNPAQKIHLTTDPASASEELRDIFYEKGGELLEGEG